MNSCPRPSRLHRAIHGPGLNRAKKSSACVLALGAMAGGTALAQSADQGVQTVTVTANKRAQTLQDVPQSVTAITGNELDRKGIQRWEDALAGVPNVSVSSSGSLLGNNVAMRGVSDGAAGGLTQSTVAMYIDELPVTVAQAAGNPSLLLYDIDKITVIRGPRSTLYGSSSLGGTLKIETLNPSLRRSEGFGRLGYGRPSHSGESNTELAASYSTPLSENVAALGITAYRVGTGGVVDSPTLLKDADGLTTKGARLVLYVEPAKGFSASVKFYAQDMDSKAKSTIDASKGGDLVAPATAVLEAGTDRFRAGTLTLKYKTDAFEVVSATSHFDKTGRYITDLTSFFGPVLAGFGVPADTPILTTGRFASKVNAQELRVVSTETKTGWSWSAGLFYSDENTDNNANTPSAIGEIFGSLTNFKHKQTALFGEAGYRFGNGLELAAGLRRTEYRASDTINLLGLFAVPGTNAVNTTDKPVTPHLSAAWRFDGQMIYAQASKGFRPGKGNFPVIPVPGIDVPTFASADSLWTYEVGAKTSWLGNRITANVAGYHTDWKNPQLTLFLPTGFSYINSLGALNPGASVKVDGLELELAARPVPELRITAGLGFANSTFNQDVKGLDAGGGLVAAGSRLAGTPRMTANASLRYDFSLMGRPSIFDAGLRYQGSYFSDYTSATKKVIGGFTTVDLRLTTTFGENLDVAAYVNNATDQHPFLTLAGAPYNWANIIRPRTVGVTGTYRF